MTSTASIEEHVNSAIQKVQEEFSSRVARIGYSSGEDQWGYPSIFFRILIRDGLSKEERHEVMRQVPRELMNEAQLIENGFWGYSEFRTDAEQREMREPRWDK